jgi:hypothetical protein
LEKRKKSICKESKHILTNLLAFEKSHYSLKTFNILQKPPAGDEVMMESWLNGVQKKSRASPEGHDPNDEYYGVSKSGEENAAVVDEYGDVDYRQQIDDFEPKTDRRTRRAGSPVDDFGTMAKRARTDSNEDIPEHLPLPQRRGPIRTSWTAKQICKFFREGYCRDSANCAYSHNAEDSRRRPELCRFYQNGYCKRGLACPNLHGEYPCKAFHKGECSKEQCQFSHQSLTDYTQAIFDQVCFGYLLIAKQCFADDP